MEKAMLDYTRKVAGPVLVKDMQLGDRPREKFLSCGGQA